MSELHTCPVTHWVVQPLSVTPCGFGVIAWACSACDQMGNGRHDEGYNGADPGLHYEFVTAQTPPKVYPWKKLKKRAA